MKRPLLVMTVIGVYLLHQDFWNWRDATPLVFGFLPIGLFYHLCYTLLVAVVMYLLVKHAWPAHLEKSIDRPQSNPRSAIRNPQSSNRRVEDRQ
jgi:hypothetical protein